MTRQFRASPRLALTMLAATFLLVLPAQGGWRQAGELNALVEELETWLDANAVWPRRAQKPGIRWVNARTAAAMTGSSNRGDGPTPRGIYDEETQTIFLVRPWNAGDAQDAGVLLHELAHHRQATAGHWYCDGARELPAYRLQEAWLNAQGLVANVNWIAVVLESGCTARDIHPD